MPVVCNTVVVVFIHYLNGKQNRNMDFSINIKTGSSPSDYCAEVSEDENSDHLSLAVFFVSVMILVFLS